MSPATQFFKDGYLVIAVVAIHAPRQDQLPVVARALRSLSRGFGMTQNRKQQRGENGNDGNDHEQFDESKCPLLHVAGRVYGFRFQGCVVRRSPWQMWHHTESPGHRRCEGRIRPARNVVSLTRKTLTSCKQISISGPRALTLIFAAEPMVENIRP